MAIMIPSEIPSNAPESEKIIFENLKRASQARDWIVFHSEYTDNPDNPTRPREIDFLILIPEYCSVICLEAKGGSYKISNGRWYSLSSHKPVIPSPPEQARTAMFALAKNEFEATHFGPDSLLSLGCAVAFTDSQFPCDIRKPKQALIIERSDTRDPNKLVEKLTDYADNLPIQRVRRLLGTNRNKWLEALEALDNLKLELEPEETVIIKPPERITRQDLETLHPQLLRLTNDQLNSLKRVRLNDRCVIDGAAGTGKTVLAMELARQRCEEDESVALLCSNPNLSRRFVRWAGTLSSDSGGKVVAGTPATLLFGVFPENSILSNKHRQRLEKWPQLEESLRIGYLDNGWSPFIDEVIGDLGPENIFDYLIIDEAQNLCDGVFLKLMDALLKGGLTDGRWTMFGDFTNQDIVSSRPNGTDALTDFGLNWSNDMLETNCRNTYEISDAVARLVDVESPPMSGVHGPLVHIEYFKSLEELGDLLDHLVVNFKEQHFLSRQIILLSSGSGDEFDTKRTYGGWQLLNIRKETLPPLKSTEGVLVYDDPSPDDTLRYSDVYDFQGLESDLAILVLSVTGDQVVLAGDITLPREEHLNRVLYTGMSRAKTMLIVVAHKSYRETLEDRWELYD